jgi:phage tail-like protein
MSADAPISAVRFRVEIDGLRESRALEVVFPEARIAARRSARSANAVQFGPLILARVLTGSNEWYDWWNAARHKARRIDRTVTVIMMDAGGSDARRSTFARTRPVAYQLSSLNATSEQLLIERMELVVGDFLLGA